MYIFVLLSLIWIFPSTSWAVTKDSSSNAQCTVSPCTTSHTVTSSGKNRAIFLLCGLRHRTITLTATYAGTSMTEVRRDQHASTNLSTWVFQLANPATGANNWSVTQTGGTVGISCNAVSFTNVNQSVLTNDNQGICQTTSTSDSLTLTTSSTSILLDVIDSDSLIAASLAPGANQTNEYAPVQVNSNLTVGASLQNGTDGGVMSFSWTGTIIHCYTSISVNHQNPVSGGGVIFLD